MYANQFQNQQQQLPYNPQAPQQPFLNIGLNNPPYVPQDYAGDPYLMQYVPLVSAALAMEIQQQAQKNPLRMFMFNQYSQNAFANQDFDALVKATLDYMLFGLKTNRWQNGEQAAQQAVPEMAEMLCAINMRLFGGLESFIDQNMANAIRHAIGQFDKVCADINMMKNQMSGSFQQQQQGGWNQQPRGGFSSMSNQQPSWNRSSNSNMGGGVGGSSMLFSGGPVNNQPLVNQTMGTVSVGKYGNTPAQATLAQPFTPRQEKPAMQAQAPAPVVPPVVQPATEVLANSGTIEWRPSAQWPYVPAYTPSTQELYYKAHPDGSVEPIVKQRNPAMDYERHATSFGPIPKGLDLSNSAKTMTNIETGIKELNGAAEKLADNEPAVPEITTYVNDKIMLDTCLNSAWFTGSIERMMAPSGQIPAVYRMYASIGDPMISLHDETEAILNYANSNTFIELREKLNSSIKDVSQELWGASNMRATEAINRILAQNMSLPKLSIDSFVIDIQDLLDILEKNYGPKIQESFLKNQRDIIKALFGNFNAQASEMAASFLEGRTFAEGMEPKISFLASNYSLTYLDCVSHELDIELVKDVASAAIKDVTPVIYEMLHGLFKDTDARTAVDGKVYLRHLIRTNDGRILEATRGYIGTEFYLLTLIK